MNALTASGRCCTAMLMRLQIQANCSADASFTPTSNRRAWMKRFRWGGYGGQPHRSVSPRRRGLPGNLAHETLRGPFAGHYQFLGDLVHHGWAVLPAEHDAGNPIPDCPCLIDNRNRDGTDPGSKISFVEAIAETFRLLDLRQVVGERQGRLPAQRVELTLQIIDRQ